MAISGAPDYYRILRVDPQAEPEVINAAYRKLAAMYHPDVDPSPDAKTRMVDGQLKRGFEYYVGGGLGAVPYPATLFDEFLPEEELLPITQAVCRRSFG